MPDTKKSGIAELNQTLRSTQVARLKHNFAFLRVFWSFIFLRPEIFGKKLNFGLGFSSEQAIQNFKLLCSARYNFVRNSTAGGLPLFP